MALVQIAWGRAGAESMSGTGLPIFSSLNAVAESLYPVSALTAVSTTTTSLGSGRGLCRISTDSQIWVSFGKTPDAANPASQRFLIQERTDSLLEVEKGVYASVVLNSETLSESPGTGGANISSGVDFSYCRALNSASAFQVTSVKFMDGSVVAPYAMQIGYNPISVTNVVGTWSAGGLTAIY